jgi:hypothetical protein
MNSDTLFEKISASGEMEKLFEWKRWMKEIPALQFKREWFVRIIPPYHTGIIRFRVSLQSDFVKDVSIYLDCYGLAGAYGPGDTCEPYWEMYPYSEDDPTFRCGMNETEELLEAIERSLKEQNI